MGAVRAVMSPAWPVPASGGSFRAPTGPSWRRIGRLRPRGGAPAGIRERPDAAGDSTPPHPLSAFYYYYSSRAAGPVDRLAFALVRLYSVFLFVSFMVSCCSCADDDDDEEDEEGARAITAIMLLMVSGTEKKKDKSSHVTPTTSFLRTLVGQGSIPGPCGTNGDMGRLRAVLRDHGAF